jgi:hypothetical protein
MHALNKLVRGQAIQHGLPLGCVCDAHRKSGRCKVALLLNQLTLGLTCRKFEPSESEHQYDERTRHYKNSKKIKNCEIAVPNLG